MRGRRERSAARKWGDGLMDVCEGAQRSDEGMWEGGKEVKEKCGVWIWSGRR